MSVVYLVFKLIKFQKVLVYQNFINFRWLILLSLGLVAHYSNGQTNRKIDSLLNLVDSKADQFEVMYSLGYEYIDLDNVAALEYGKKAYNIAEGRADSAQMVRSVRIMGSAYRRLGRIQDAIIISTRGLGIASRNGFTEDEKIILNSVALAHTLQGEYDKALEYNFRSLVIREKEGNKPQISIALNNIGLVYFNLRNYEMALRYYQKSLATKNEVKDNHDLDRLYFNIGLCNIHLKNFKVALEYFDQGFKICGNECAPEINVEGGCGLGIAYYYLGDIEQAEKQFHTSLELAIKTDYKRYQAENLVYLGRVSLKKNDFEQCEKFLERAEVIAKTSGYNQLLIDTYKEYAKLFNITRNFERASEYQNLYIHLKDSLIGEDLVKNIAKIQTNFEERENLNTIKLREEDLARQRNLNIAIGLIAVLAGLLVFVLYRSNAITRRVNSALSDAKGVIETQNHRLQNINRELDAKVKEKTADLQKANEDLDKANKALVRVNDELDNFIYKTSHDIRGPLASLKGICSVALMDVKDPLALDYLTKLDVSSGRLNVILTRLLIVNQINHAIVGREHIDFNGIVDDVLLLEKKKGLPERLEIKREIDAEINFQSDKDLVRIILENLIDNSIKFYNDSERIKPFVHIKIAVQNNEDVVVSVIDNGIGIAEAKPDKIFQMFSRASERSGTGGIGLYLSKLATEKLGGQINLRSTAEGYTEFYVSFPLKMQAS